MIVVKSKQKVCETVPYLIYPYCINNMEYTHSDVLKYRKQIVNFHFKIFNNNFNNET